MKKEINMTAQPMETARYAIGATETEGEGQSELLWAHVIGSKITTGPDCLDGINLLLSIWTLIQILGTSEDVQDKTEQRNLKIVINLKVVSNDTNVYLILGRGMH